MIIESKKKEFLEYLHHIRGYSVLTLKSYKEALQEAFLYIEMEQKDDFFTLNLMPYRVKIAHLNPKTISKKLSAIRSFALFLNDNGIKTTLKSDDTIKVAKTLPKPVSHKHILEAIDTIALEDRLLVTLLYTLGLRISELSELSLENIGSEWVRVLGKGAKTRDIPILKSTKQLIDQYLEQNSNKKYIFEKNGEKLSQNILRYNISKIFKRVGLKVTPHQLRHSYATEMLNQNAPISDVSELLGHSSLATTQIYTKLGSSIKLQNYNKAHPLNKAKE